MRKKKKKIAIGIGIGIIVIAGILLAVSQGMFLSKANQILLATAKTVDQSQLIEDMNPVEILQEEYTVGVNTTINNISVKASYAATSDEKTLTASIGASLLDDKIKMTLVLENGLVSFQIPLVSNNVYTYSYADEKTGCLTNLFSEEQIGKLDEILEELSKETPAADTQTVKEQLSDMLLEEFRSLTFLKATSETYEVNGRDKECKAYETELTNEKKEEILAYIQEMYEGEDAAEMEQLFPKRFWEVIEEKTTEFEDAKLTFYIGGGQLAAIRIDTNETDIVVELRGTDESQNERMVISNEDETLLDLKYQDEDGTFKIKSGEYHSGSVAGTLTRAEDSIKISMTEFKWGNKEGALTISLQAGATCAVLEEEGDVVDLNTMTDDDFKRIFWKIIWMKSGGLT